MSDPTPLRVLIVDDAADDADLQLIHLRRGGFAVEALRVDHVDDLVAALGESWDVVLVDWYVPGLPAAQALLILRADVNQGIPCIVVSGVSGEEVAVAAIRMGARDFVRKDQLERLALVVRREVTTSCPVP